LAIHIRDCKHYYDMFEAGLDGYYMRNDIEHTFEDTNPVRGVLPTSRMKI